MAKKPNQKREYWFMMIFSLVFMGAAAGMLIQKREYAGQILAFAAVPSGLLVLWSVLMWRLRKRLATDVELFGVLAVLGLCGIAGATGLAAWGFLFSQ